MPLDVMPLTATLNVVGPPVINAVSIPPAVLPVKLISPESNPVTAELKTAVKLIGETLVGSVCDPASAPVHATTGTKR